MDALGLFWHLVNLFLPAAGLAAITAGLCKLFWRKTLAGVSWWSLAWPSAALAALVTFVGLVVTGHDGKMGTYVCMVVACALVPWVRTVRR